MIYDEKAGWLKREDGELTVHVDELEDGIVYFQDRLNNMFGVSMLEIEEIIALGGRDYAAGRRAGIEEALQAYRSTGGQSTDPEVRIASLLRRHCGTIESIEPDGSAIVRTGK